jgi:hypothetical protein
VLQNTSTPVLSQGNLVNPVALSDITGTEWHNTVRRLRDCTLPNTQDRITDATDYWNKHFMDDLGPTLRRNIACPRNHDHKVSELDSTYIQLQKWVKSEVRKYTAVLSKVVRKIFCSNGFVLCDL